MKVSKHSDTEYGMIMRGNVTDSSLTGPMAGQTLAIFRQRLRMAILM